MVTSTATTSTTASNVYITFSLPAPHQFDLVRISSDWSVAQAAFVNFQFCLIDPMKISLGKMGRVLSDKPPYKVSVAAVSGENLVEQTAYWPESLMMPCTHDFKIGDTVVVCPDDEYVKKALAKYGLVDTITAITVAHKKIMGRVEKITDGYLSHGGSSKVRQGMGKFYKVFVVGGFAFSEDCLIPFARETEGSPGGSSGDELSNVLEALYDASLNPGKKGDILFSNHRDSLLGRYRALTGRDRPEFMRGYPGV